MGDEALVILEVLADGTRATVRHVSGWLGGLMQAQAKAEKEAAEAKARAQEEARIKAEAEEAARCERVDRVHPLESVRRRLRAAALKTYAEQALGLA